MKEQIAERLRALRAQMARRGIAATIVPQTDPHQSEYLSAHWQLRRWLSGFTGSAGDLVVTADKALLWTDSRYFLQAAQQLEGTETVLMKDGLGDTPSIAAWLGAELHAGDTVGIDGMVHSASATASLIGELERHGINTVTDFDPANDVWTDRPALPEGKIFVHDEKYAGESAKSKIARVLELAANEGADSVFISALDEIAWTLNIRANDVTYNPVVTAFLYLSGTGSTLLVDSAKLTPEVERYLAEEGVRTQPYANVKSFLGSLPADARVLVEPARNAVGIVNALGPRALAGPSAVAIFKATKNDVQAAGIKAAMLRDGVAMVKAYMEIDRRLAGEGEPLTELGVCEIFRRYRSEQPLFFDESFGTIAGFGGHGAIVHYEPDAESDAAVKTGNLLLIDSGAQYLDGTTDITRTISIGEPTAQQKEDFTLVLKGHIALGSAIFPERTTGHQLDVLARQFLWSHGMNYLHGTGHGVGHFLNVHEGPMSIRLNHVPVFLHPGMILSNEPGIYRTDIHGIRLENLVLVVPAMETEFGKFYKFETLTLCPFDARLVDADLMSDAELAWFNDYQARVAAELTPLLDSEAEREWLRAHTAAVKR